MHESPATATRTGSYDISKRRKYKPEKGALTPTTLYLPLYFYLFMYLFAIFLL